MVVGSRTMGEARDQRPRVRRWITRGFNRLLKLLFQTRFSDTHGNKAIWRQTVQPLIRLCHTDRWVFITELLLLCERSGRTVRELPVVAEEVRGSRYALWQQVPFTLMNLSKLFWYLRVRPPRLPQSGGRVHRMDWS